MKYQFLIFAFFEIHTCTYGPDTNFFKSGFETMDRRIHIHPTRTSPKQVSPNLNKKIFLRKICFWVFGQKPAKIELKLSFFLF